jgi:hypothetical protein
MIATTFADFFLGTAGAAAALIGLLFVSVSVVAARTEQQTVQSGLQVRAAGALLAFSNVLTVSLVALIPDTRAGWAAAGIGATGVLFAVSSAKGMTRENAQRNRGAVYLVVMFFLLFGLELTFGVLNLITPSSSTWASGIAGVLVYSLGVGVSRAWDLLGMEQAGVFGSIKSLFSLDH